MGSTKHPQIINYLNFIRATMTDRVPEGDNLLAVKEQIKLAKKYGLKTTFLVLYDVFDDPEYLDLLLPLDREQFEFGIWYEIDQALCEAAGIPWRADYPWYKHCDIGYPIGYSLADRERLADENFRRFKEVFGTDARVFGSWFTDTYSINYICGKYGLDAMCNCKEQYGTDGYTLWGGYWGQAYYPSVKNVFIPAGSKENQTNVPMFKMLGSDPIYQYDFGMDIAKERQHSQEVITLEPVWEAGANPAWVDWYLKENFNGECLSFGYAQAGQENSFGWQRIGAGLPYQLEQMSRMQAEGKLVIEHLGESGRRYKQAYETTPMSSVTAHSAADDPGKQTVWFCSANYRVNLYAEDGEVWIRDLHIFDDSIPDPFAEVICTGSDATYETLPAVDGFTHSGNGVRSGLYIRFADDKAPSGIKEDILTYTETEDGCRADFKAQHPVSVTMKKNSLAIESDTGFRLEHRIGCREEFMPEVVSCTERELTLSYGGKRYKISLSSGKFLSPLVLEAEEGQTAAYFTVL